MQRVSRRGTPLWAKGAAVLGVIVALIIVLGVFFGVSAALFFWLNGVTRSTLPGMNQQTMWGVPVGRIVYALFDGTYDLYIEKAGYGAPLAIIFEGMENGDEVYPSFSPDGNQIVFQADPNRYDNLFIIDVDGANLTQITDDENENRQPDWSPDGARIAFSALGEDGGRYLYLIDADGGNQSQLTTSGDDTNPAWSPDGSQIAFIRTTDTSVDLYVIDADGSNETKIVSDPKIEHDPRWSPDGSQLLFVLTATSNMSELYTVAPDGSNLALFSSYAANQGHLACPMWSPDSRHVGMIWGPPGITYQNIQIYDISAGQFSGTAAAGGTGTTVLGCDWGW